jgi:hypothetical protein
MIKVITEIGYVILNSVLVTERNFVIFVPLGKCVLRAKKKNEFFYFFFEFDRLVYSQVGWKS